MRIDLKPRCIGLSGKMASGKTTVANLLEKLGYERIRFAAPLYKLIEHAANDEARQAHNLLRRLFNTSAWFLPTVLKGYDDLCVKHRAVLKSGEKPRAFMQELGTNVCRNVYEHVWVDALLRSLEPGRCYVCDDMRFPNEAQGLKSAGWTLVRCCVPEAQRLQRLTDLYGGYDEVALKHPSETALDGWAAWDIELDTSVPMEQQAAELAETLAKYVEAQNNAR